MIQNTYQSYPSLISSGIDLSTCSILCLQDLDLTVFLDLTISSKSEKSLLLQSVLLVFQQEHQSVMQQQIVQ